jgi:hypothetical protein
MHSGSRDLRERRLHSPTLLNAGQPMSLSHTSLSFPRMVFVAFIAAQAQMQAASTQPTAITMVALRSRNLGPIRPSNWQRRRQESPKFQQLSSDPQTTSLRKRFDQAAHGHWDYLERADSERAQRIVLPLNGTCRSTYVYSKIQVMFVTGTCRPVPCPVCFEGDFAGCFVSVFDLPSALVD